MIRLPAGVWGAVTEAITTKFREIREKSKPLVRSERKTVRYSQEFACGQQQRFIDKCAWLMW